MMDSAKSQATKSNMNLKSLCYFFFFERNIFPINKFYDVIIFA